MQIRRFGVLLSVSMVALSMVSCSKGASVPPAYPKASIVLYPPENKGTMSVSLQSHNPNDSSTATGNNLKSLPKTGSAQFNCRSDNFVCGTKWKHVISRSGTDEYEFQVNVGESHKTFRTFAVQLKGKPVELLKESGYRLVVEPTWDHGKSVVQN